MKRALIHFLVVVALVSAAILSPWPPAPSVVAESLAKIEERVATAEKEAAALHSKFEEQQSEQTKNLRAQKAAKDAGKEEEVRALKTSGEKIGRKLNSLRESILSKDAEISELLVQIRKAALLDVKAKVESAAANGGAKAVSDASKSLASWGRALSKSTLPVHREERLPRRATSDSRRRAKREEGLLKGYQSLLKAESKRLSNASTTLKALVKMELAAASWAGLQKELKQLQTSIKTRSKTVASRIKAAKTRASKLAGHQE